MIASATKRICPSDFSLTRTVYYINIIDDRCCSNTYSACFSPFIPASKHPSVTQKLFLAQTAKKRPRRSATTLQQETLTFSPSVLGLKARQGRRQQQPSRHQSFMPLGAPNNFGFSLAPFLGLWGQ